MTTAQKTFAAMMNGYTSTPALLARDAAIGNQLDTAQTYAEFKALLAERRKGRRIIEGMHNQFAN